MVSDPAGLKQYDPPHYRTLYIILLLIPLLLILAGVFWLLFNINGRGVREIKYSFEKATWEKRDVAKEMENIRVGMKIMPSENN